MIYQFGEVGAASDVTKSLWIACHALDGAKLALPDCATEGCL